MKISKSSVFLFELMVVIMVFTIAAAICTSIFAESYMMSRESSDLTMSSINAQTLAEKFKAGEENIDVLFFDRHWESSNDSNSTYKIELTPDPTEGNIASATIEATRDGKSIYSLTVKEYIG